MCGIAGILRFDGAPAQGETLKRMTDVLAHRGPDGEGAFTCGPIGLGHRRLAILDLSSAGRQPMCDESARIWVTFNGEIYNFREIRSELEGLGHCFRSRTDTEVIPHAYEEWGIDCVHRFNGMFAFALWDDGDRRLWLVRDRLGVKPLFYCRLPHALLFASEIKGILSEPSVPRSLNHEALSYFLALNYTPAPHTLFDRIRQVMPGHYLAVDAQGDVRDVGYWDLRFQEEECPNRNYVEEFEAILQDAVSARLVSDVPFGAFLSGGIDSSAVAYWMSRFLKDPVKTFTVAFGEPTFDEDPYARQVAAIIGSEHHEQRVSVDAAALLPKLVWHAEEPTADSSMVAVYALAQETRQHVTMVLSGDGGDETWAGYETYQAHYLHRALRTLPSFVSKHLFQAITAVLPVSDTKVSWDFKMRRLLAAARLSPDDAFASWRTVFDADARAQILSPVWDHPGARADALDLYRAAFARSNAHHPLNRMLYVDTLFYLPNDMLVKVDRMTMAHSLEARGPFLDYRLVEFAATVPPRYKLRHLFCKKYLLKASMKGRLPDQILRRKKAGFNVPNARWIKGELKPFVTDHLSEERLRRMGVLDPRAVETVLRDHFQGRADNSHQIWCMLTLVLWWGQFMERGQDAS
jgi:asparagine synthase (glutamine-hydrolysing)